MQYEIKYMLEFFYIQFWFKCENGLQKKLFIKKINFFL